MITLSTKREEVIMKALRIEDRDYDEVEVSLYGSTSILLEFNPDDVNEKTGIAVYSPKAARELAAALIIAADEVENK